MTDRERACALNRAHATGGGAKEVLHMYPVRPRALLYAEQIAFPVAPDTALVWADPAPMGAGPCRARRCRGRLRH